MLSAQVLHNPAGIPPEAPKLQPFDYTYAASLLTVDEIISKAGRNTEAQVEAGIKTLNITFTLQPFIDSSDDPKLWLEAYTANPDKDPNAKLIGMAKVSFNTDEESLKQIKKSIKQHIQSRALLHEE